MNCAYRRFLEAEAEGASLLLDQWTQFGDILPPVVWHVEHASGAAICLELRVKYTVFMDTRDMLMFSEEEDCCQKHC